MKKLLINRFGKTLIDLRVRFGKHYDKAKVWADRLLNELNVRSLKLIPLTPFLGIHTGPSMIGFIARQIE